MDEVNIFEDLVNKMLYLCGWIIQHIGGMFTLGTQSATIKAFDSPLVFLGFGLFLMFASLHIFKRLLRKD